MTCYFKKLRNGQWGVSVTGIVPTPGMSVFVSKRSGATSGVIISRILWQGERNGQPSALCTIGRKRPDNGTDDYPHPARVTDPLDNGDNLGLSPDC